jgi:hydroxymethylpyrimidine/phosphomethylpyrimidine kinase
MATKSPYNVDTFKLVALTIAGFDPSGGAGVLADIKTFECSGVYGVGVITCNTHQNDSVFRGVSWVSKKEKEKNMALLASRFPVKAAKLGMHKNLKDVLHSVKLCQKYFPNAQLVWDPILSASAGFDLDIKIQKEALNKILTSLFLVTPNQHEACKLGRLKIAEKAATSLSKKCPVLLKGGHSTDKKVSADLLFVKGKLKKTYSSSRIKGNGKHGSGCVFSAAITASLTKGDTLENAINRGKKYVTEFLKSNDTLTGYHLN